MEKAVLNLSGHLLSEPAVKTLLGHCKIVVDIPIPYLDFGLDVKEQTKGVASDLYGATEQYDLVGIVLPGHSLLAVIIVAILQGFMGYLPDIYVLEQSDSGIFLPVRQISVSLSELKKVARKERAKRQQSRGVKTTSTDWTGVADVIAGEKKL